MDATIRLTYTDEKMQITYKTDGEQTLDDLMYDIKAFLMAVGYHPDSISQFIQGVD